MTETRRRAYLEAMDIDLWVRRPPPPEPDRLLLAAGKGSTLLVCASDEDRATPLAADIARAVGGDPNWAWPDPEGRAESPKLSQAIEDRLVTRVVVFGRPTAERLFGSEVPDVVVSATVSVAADFEELAIRGTAKQSLWALLQAAEGGTAPT
jgi:hypothetical protein